MKYYMAYLYEDVINGMGVEEILGFTLANSREEARLNMKHIIKGRQPIVVGVMELSGERELENTRKEITSEINDLKKASARIKHREKLLRNIQFVKQKKNK